MHLKYLKIVNIVLILCLKFTYGIKNSDECIKNGVGKYLLTMPNISPQKADDYFCTATAVDPSNSYYITGYEPKASMNTAHHMMVYGCTEPGSTKKTWDCATMSSHVTQKTVGPCSPAHSEYLYAWARDATKLDLPDGVAFKVGKDSPVKYVVLQVHYAQVDQLKNGRTDNSGVVIKYTKTPVNKLAGVAVYGVANGVIPGNSVQKVESICEMDEDKILHPFAYRVHTHGLGKVVAGYRVREDDNGVVEWTLLGKRDPLSPQLFYPIEDNVPIIQDDMIAMRCTMESHRETDTNIGNTHLDEMCNFYLMYYVDSGELLRKPSCFTNGPPIVYWSHPELYLSNIPDIEASTLDQSETSHHGHHHVHHSAYPQGRSLAPNYMSSYAQNGHFLNKYLDNLMFKFII